MIEQHRELTGELRDRIKAQIETAQAEISQLRAQLSDVREPWGDNRRRTVEPKAFASPRNEHPFFPRF
jgi:hypothetical protein